MPATQALRAQQLQGHQLPLHIHLTCGGSTNEHPLETDSKATEEGNQGSVKRWKMLLFQVPIFRVSYVSSTQFYQLFRPSHVHIEYS